MGAFRGYNRTVGQIAAIALKAVTANTYEGLREIYYCAFNEDEYYTLIEVAFTLGMKHWHKHDEMILESVEAIVKIMDCILTASRVC